MRIEKDIVGNLEVPPEALYGIHALRAQANFPHTLPFNKNWYKAIGMVKAACYQTSRSFISAARKKNPDIPLPVGCEKPEIFDTLEEVALEINRGLHFEHFIVPAIQGGAGTAINMNINEIIANRALILAGRKPGDYAHIDPFIHANLFQSTNDVIPSALKLAAMLELNTLEENINALRSALEGYEKNHRSDLRLGFTQMQQALPSSFGLMFSAWIDALSRDWWRISKCFERIKVINLGGGATGTSTAIPRYFVMEVCNRLQQLSRLPLTRSENPTDTTQNMDSIVEVHAILKALAVNLEKISSDIRLLASDLRGAPEIKIPPVQTGSSIMPGKANPVISEYVISCAQKVYANDMLISNLSGKGCLELNAYLPLIGHALLESIELLSAATHSMKTNMVDKMVIQSTLALEKLMYSPSLCTALIPFIGYEKAGQMAALMQEKNISLPEANDILKLISGPKLKEILQAENLLKGGYSLNDIL